MKFVRFGDRGHEKPGLIDDDGNCRDLSGVIDDIAGDVLTRLRDLPITVDDLPIVEGHPRLGACVGAVGKFICIGLNYSDHAAETGADDDDPGAVRRFGMRQVQRKRLALQLGLPIATSDDM